MGLRLTLLAPDIVEAILGGRQSAQMTLARLMRPFPVGWREQRAMIAEWEDSGSAGNVGFWGIAEAPDKVTSG